MSLRTYHLLLLIFMLVTGGIMWTGVCAKSLWCHYLVVTVHVGTGIFLVIDGGELWWKMRRS